ncbi:unnamed protein product [Parascedosporium putredinis]|uniref:GED domain-containing protein n=1 Tax=Parascedosporium putredinis TaxID=1442378 RepID=A0A9P1H5X8_9PEZI|nr:unnamed protein product [Parascedosporium putredinis]CAI7997512.1 unnamed protein product [Parascedosporium putredinis]
MRQTVDSALNTAGLADEQRGLLDLVDKLQFAQLDNVKLPQIVVVGDQFATEIRMRRSKEDVLNVSIIPDKNRPFNEQQRLKQFGGTVNQNTSFDSMMRDAGELIAPRNIPGRFAARDILVVEKTGPDMPLLTLVDLPGLVRVANRDQSDADIQTIEALSDRYMKSSRTIILAVIGGNNDYVQAPILQKARQFDPTGSRTIGVLTKPDLTEKIGLEDKFIGLVTNKDKENHFKLGWFVLLNPGPPAKGEDTGKWSTLPPNMCGVGPLRQKLSVQLQRHIGRHVNTLRKQIQEAHTRCEAELKALGVGKDTVEEMRFQMGELFSACNNLVTASVNGNYKNPPGERFFPKAATRKGTPGQRLRARVREESERFSQRFRDSGRKVGFSESEQSIVPNGMMGGRSKSEFAKREVEPLLRQIRGTELPMDSNPRAPYILFQDYSENWPVLAQEYKDNVGVICNEFLAEVVEYVWPTRMRDPLRGHFLEPNVAELVQSAEKELSRLVDDMELEVQPFDPEYEERLRAWRMLIYYDLTGRIFIRNVITQVVERHLLLGMLRLFNPLQILKMENQVVEGIAAEDKLTRDRRMALKQQKKAIEEAKSLCASLAMRSELRGFDGALEDNVDSDDEEDMHRYADAPAFQQGRGQQQQQQQQQQPRQEQSRQEQSRQEQQIPLQREPQRYSQGQTQQQAPKPEEDGDADSPRSSYPQSPNRPDSKRESTRHRYNILGR